MQINSDALLYVLQGCCFYVMLMVQQISTDIWGRKPRFCSFWQDQRRFIVVRFVSSYHPPPYIVNLDLGTLNNTKTTLGRSLLRTWLLRPTLSIPVINARHDAVACFLRPENIGTADMMHSNLKGIKNVPRILGIMRTGRAKVSDWKGLVTVR
jgi:hypothetical protein